MAGKYTTPVNGHLFSKHLPEGKYTVIIPASGGLTDLAGLTPVAQGQPAGVLLEFSVAPTPPPADPNELGLVTQHVNAEVVQTVTIPVGAKNTYHFVVPVQDYYEFAFVTSGGSVNSELSGPGGTITLDDTNPLQLLIPGIYSLVQTATGDEPVKVQTFIRLPGYSVGQYWDNGLGQGPALNIAIIPSTTPVGSPPGSSSGGAPGPTGFTVGSVSTPLLTSTPPTQTSSSPGSFSLSIASSAPGPVGSSGLILTLGNLVGSPSASATQVAVVGPGTESGATALAYNGQGVLQGITYGFTNVGRSSSETVDGQSAEKVLLKPTNGAIPLALQPSPATRDDQTLIDAKAAERLGGILAGWFAGIGGSLPSPANTPIAPVGSEGLVARLDPVREEEAIEEPEDDQAGFGTPLAVGLATVLLLKLGQPIRRWFSRVQEKSHAKPGPSAGRAPSRA